MGPARNDKHRRGHRYSQGEGVAEGQMIEPKCSAIARLRLLRRRVKARGEDEVAEADAHALTYEHRHGAVLANGCLAARELVQHVAVVGLAGPTRLELGDLHRYTQGTRTAHRVSASGLRRWAGSPLWDAAGIPRSVRRVWRCKEMWRSERICLRLDLCDCTADTNQVVIVRIEVLGQVHSLCALAATGHSKVEGKATEMLKALRDDTEPECGVQNMVIKGACKHKTAHGKVGSIWETAREMCTVAVWICEASGHTHHRLQSAELQRPSALSRQLLVPCWTPTAAAPKNFGPSSNSPGPP